MRYIRSALTWIFSAAFWTVFIFLIIWFPKEVRFRGLFWGGRFWGRTALWLGGVKRVLVNESFMDDRSAKVVVVNHQSTLDVLWGASMTPPGLLAIGKKEVRYIPILNLIWWAFHFILVDRSNTEKAVAALQGVEEEIVRNDRTLCVAPEGTRTKTGEILPFKKGAFRIALGAQVPICPLLVHGAFELMPKGALAAKPGTIWIKYLDPIPTKGMTLEDLPALMERVRETMVREFESLRRNHPLEA